MRALTKAEDRSPKSREFGVRLTLIQIDAILTSLLMVQDKYVAFPDSHDTATERLKKLYESITGKEWQYEEPREDKQTVGSYLHSRGITSPGHPTL